MSVFLTPHFSFNELTHTNRKEYLRLNQEVARSLIYGGVALCAILLEPIRCYFNAPVVIHSGFRCIPLNKAIGGSETSQHRLFQAADFHVGNHDLQEVFEWVCNSSLPFGQLLLEGRGQDIKPTWIHLSLGEPWRERERCRQTGIWSREGGLRILPQE